MTGLAGDVYSSEFFRQYTAGSLSSAERILPIIISLLRPSSAVDIGCGLGSWTKVLLDLGVDATGVDGDYVEPEQLAIPSDRFLPRDLKGDWNIGGRFGLAISLEVAEHLPENVGPDFVKKLTELAPAVLFSAAVPYQGGEYHINEQWQSYWQELFDEYGYDAYDPVRPVVWNDPAVDPWYSQNMLLYSRYRIAAPRPAVLDLVHPTLYSRQNADPNLARIGDTVRKLPSAIARSPTGRRYTRRIQRLRRFAIRRVRSWLLS